MYPYDFGLTLALWPRILQIEKEPIHSKVFPMSRLPTFECPPLDEMVAGVQFESFKQFGLQHLFRYFSQIREKYPKIEDQIPLPHVSESQAIRQGQPFFGVQNKLPLPRCWFLTESGHELIQVQHDRFLRNWRMMQGDRPYPHFDSLFDVFYQEWSGFQAFLQEEKLGRPKVDQCELVYINAIEIDRIQHGFGGLANVFSLLQKSGENGFLPEPELLNWGAKYHLPNGGGRLHVDATPTFRARDFKLILNFTLTARGNPKSTSDGDVKTWFHLAHEWIVRAFDELTTPEMHKIWRKKS